VSQALSSKLMPRLLLHPSIGFAALLTLVPFFAAAFCPRTLQLAQRVPLSLRILAPALLGLPYALVSASAGLFRWTWLALYTLLPVLISLLLYGASLADPEQRGEWRDFIILGVLGLAVDLRWFEPAWGPGLAIFNKVLLLDAGIYGFLGIRQLRQVGFDLRLRLRDFRVGLLWLAAYTPIAVALGLLLRFLHFHPHMPSAWHVLLGWIFTFLFVAVPEELFFRGWMQNLLERRVGPVRALLITATLFGLSHFNKRAVHFNWRYVLLALLAGIFYGRAWFQDRRVGASAITHASVDTIWSVWLR
jgi:membrane protease YdiL (CAAX protease family)